MMPSVTDKFSEWLSARTGLCLVAGPCSVESAEQVRDTALALAKHNVSLLRGGIWKPRTRPGSFEGVGAQGLAWLKAAGDAAGLPVATEVASARHVEQCLEAGIDVLWIGARTATSPLTVQEIADSLSGIDIPVMVKNPMNPDLDLWQGAIERIRRAGISRIVAIHRGFSTHTRHQYRNQPLWSLALAFRQRCPEIPMLCDPSHIGGAQRFIGDIARDAVECGMDGLMIESHCRPQQALSDACQQVTPEQLAELVRPLREAYEMGVPYAEREQGNLHRQLREVEEDLELLHARRKELQAKLR